MLICCSRFSVHCHPAYEGTITPLSGKGNLRLWDFMEFIQGRTQKEIDIYYVSCNKNFSGVFSGGDYKLDEEALWFAKKGTCLRTLKA